MTEEKTVQNLDENFESVLAVVAHPDDLEYGAASAIARWTDVGKHVSYLLVTRGEAGIDGMNPSDAGPAREIGNVHMYGNMNADVLYLGPPGACDGCKMGSRVTPTCT